MSVNLNYTSLILHLLLLKSNAISVSIQPESHEFYMTEIVRVKRQAGYVYNKPSLSFDLPSRSPTVSTQVPNVDRTQAQQMYYAYPAPAPAGGSGGNAGYSSGPAGGGGGNAGYSSGPTGDDGGNTGYASGPTSGGVSTASASGSGASGYNYGLQTTSNSAATQTAIVSGSIQTSDVGSYQLTSTAGSSQTASNTGSSGYGYNAPTPSVSVSNAGSVVDISTSAPKYLPPFATAGAGGNGNIAIGTGETLGSLGSTGPSVSAGIVPSDIYLPAAQAPTQTPAPFSPSATPTVTIGSQTGVGVPGSAPSVNYLPPNPSAPSPPFLIPSNPRQPVLPPSVAYLPPNPTGFTGSSIQGTSSTPAATYLPPVF